MFVCVSVWITERELSLLEVSYRDLSPKKNLIIALSVIVVLVVGLAFIILKLSTLKKIKIATFINNLQVAVKMDPFPKCKVFGTEPYWIKR